MNNKIKMFSIVFEHTQRKLIIFLISIRFLSEVVLPIAKNSKENPIDIFILRIQLVYR